MSTTAAAPGNVTNSGAKLCAGWLTPLTPLPEAAILCIATLLATDGLTLDRLGLLTGANHVLVSRHEVDAAVPLLFRAVGVSGFKPSLLELRGGSASGSAATQVCPV